MAGLTKDPGILEPGFICVGIPIGTYEYVKEMLELRVLEVEQEVERATQLLGEERHCLWTILRSSTLHK